MAVLELSRVKQIPVQPAQQSRVGRRPLREFHDAFRAASSQWPEHENNEGLSNIKNALEANAFKADVCFEPIFGRSEILAYEALARPEGNNGQLFPIQTLANQMYTLGFGSQLDTLTTLNALSKIENFPVTLNISVESALSEAFWDSMIPKLAIYDPKSIIFEILEHDVSVDANTMVLEAVRGAGYRFALDDFGLGGLHNRRLQVFGDIVDFIKIDGAYLQKLYVHEPESLKALIRYLNAEYPQAELIAEHVKHFDQAEILFALGFTGVQGRNLRRDEYFWRR